ncbi:MAG TPA: multicopper oxidase domain-containing protein [Lacipirellulaceae bacterium]|nr:multicopper oxidase domain-containing protein [Lacipirellulaceae bacterium]
MNHHHSVRTVFLLLLFGSTNLSWANSIALLNPLTQPKFVNPLPNPLDPSFIFQPTELGGSHYEIGAFQTSQNLGLVDPITKQPLSTTVWGYGTSADTATYPGKTIQALVNEPITVRWTNNLVNDFGQPLPHLLPVDTSLHWAQPDNYPDSGVPIVTHLHGGHSESASDGLPEFWFTPGFAQKGPQWVKETYSYENDQRAATLWYHDHALGITRLNVYAGMAGFYILRDERDTGQANNPLGLPAGKYEVPIVIQDRMFTEEGQLYYPSEPEVEGAPEPSVLPEFFGDHILVNGVAWPVMDVEPTVYRLRMLNGSDSRFYNLRIGSGPQFQQIGTDSGLLYAPVPRNQLVIGPGERADVVVDFSQFANQTLIMRNNARSPFPKGAVVDPRTTGQIMAFRVTGTTEAEHQIPDTLLDSPIDPLVRNGPKRKLLLFEGEDEYGRLQPMLGTTAEGGMMWDDPTTEMPQLNSVEVWEIFNSTPDAHPIHLHLVAFQVLSRQKFRASQDLMTGALDNIRLLGKPKSPAENEAGWKDTVLMFPGQVTRLIAKFDRPGEYVWHCHILSHEDHEMMRRFVVQDTTTLAEAIPEPSGLAMLALGLPMVAARMRRRGH